MKNEPTKKEFKKSKEEIMNLWKYKIGTARAYGKEYLNCIAEEI